MLTAMKPSRRWLTLLPLLLALLAGGTLVFSGGVLADPPDHAKGGKDKDDDGGDPPPPPDPAISFALNGDLAVMNDDGSNVNVILAPTSGRINDTSWSPDGGSLVFETQFVEDNATRFDLWVIDLVVTEQGVAGANLVNLVGADSVNPAWSPRGDIVAFDGLVAGIGGIFVVPPTGGDPLLVVPDPDGGYVAWATWSPDGTHLAYAQKVDGLFSLSVKEVVDEPTNDLIDGPETIVIPESAGFTRMFELDWSRSGQWIAFRGEGASLSKSIYLVDESGTFLAVPSTEVSTTQSGRGPAWSPNDQFLMYPMSSRKGPPTGVLVRQDMDTGEEVILFDRKREYATFPDWRRF